MPPISKSSAPSFTHTLLQRAHSPTTAAQIFSDKIQKRPLLLTPTTASAKDKADARAARTARREAARLRRRRKTKSKPAPLSAAQSRALCVYELRRDELRFDVYAGLHGLWSGYMRETLGLPRAGFALAEEARAVCVRAEVIGPRVAGADWHGAKVRVVRSGCVDRVGIEGIVVRETRYTFVVVTVRNKGKTVPKEGTTFRVEVELMGKDALADDAGEHRVRPLEFELLGDAIMARPPDRAGKKFKMHVPWKA